MFYFGIHCSGWIVALDSKNASTLLLYALNSNIKFYEHQTLCIVHHALYNLKDSQLFSTIQSIHLKLWNGIYTMLQTNNQLICVLYVWCSLFSIHMCNVQHSHLPFPYFWAHFGAIFNLKRMLKAFIRRLFLSSSFHLWCVLASWFIHSFWI